MEPIPATSDARNHHQNDRGLHPPPQHHRGTAMKKSSSRNSESSTFYGSPYSGGLNNSPLRSELGDPPESTPYASPAATLDKPPPDNSKAIVAVDKHTQYSPLRSPRREVRKPLEIANHKSSAPLPRPRAAVKEEDAPPAAKAGARGGMEEAGSTTLRRLRSREMVKRAGLGFRMSEMILCLISFSVMAADKTQGWSGDSFDRYKEYRFCLSVNVIGFAYSGFQAYDLAYHLISEKHVIRHHLRCHFDFFMDQILAYLLIAASSAAATRVVDWETNWGKDQFTEMASASIGMAFLAFVSFAFSSLISGYNLCTRELP